MKARGLWLFAAALAAGTACASLDPAVVRVDLPGVSPFPTGSLTEIVVTDFRDEAPIPDFEAGRALQAYLAEELRHRFKGTVSLHPRPAGDVPSPSEWREASAGRDRAVFLTGSVRLASQVRKAVDDKRVPVDGPFKLAGRGLVEQLRWTLVVELAVVSGESGEPLFERTYRDLRDYIDLEKPADFAFSELSAAFCDRLFPTLLGSSTVEERTLLRR